MHVKPLQRHSNVDQLNSRIAASRSYADASVATMTRAFARQGFTLVVERIEQYHPEAPDSTGVEIGVLLGENKIGHLYGVLGNRIHRRIRCGFSMNLRVVKEYDTGWDDGFPSPGAKGFWEGKNSRCLKGRPKIRRWAAYCAKKFREYMSMAVIPDVIEVTDS